MKNIEFHGFTVSNETILATKQEFFFTKVAPVQSITDIVLLGFSLILLPGMFISYYTIIYFFVNNFFSNVYISVNTIFECSYLSFGWEIGHPLSMYVTRGMEGVIQDVYRCVQGKRGITLHVHVRTYTITFHVFVLMCLVLLLEIQPYLHSKWMCLSEMVIFLQWDQFLLQWNQPISTLNCFSEPKLAKTVLILIK